ncbi:MAG: glycogen/starch synthase, partial [Oscillospiraceae bacterium]|nr:glycogen/starch synthase [Oscillospiraceae bacterium]
MNKIVEELLIEKHRAQPPRVLLVAAECSPFSKTGGLADVAGALPKSLGALGFETRVITPYHRCIKEKYAHLTTHLCNFEISIGWRRKYVGLEKLEAEGLTVYLVDCDDYFGDKIYRGDRAEVEQYAFFQRAVMELIPCLDFEPEILHCNDWHTAMIPFLVKTQYRGRPQGGLKTILTIHNLAFQGKFDFAYISDLLGIDGYWYRPDCIEHYGCANFMKAGFVFADRITTVSPNYAREILTPEYGEGLQNVLISRGGDVYGIVNGLDTDSFNPATDKCIAKNYDINTVFEAKRENKIALMNELGLTCSPDTPIVAMVTRMTSQKGFDLVMQRIDELMQENVAFVLLGSGDKYYEGFMRDAENRYKGRLCAYIGYSEPLSRRIYAGADFLLMPSAFEPCGLSQLISMRYGTVPIVRETGGLKDTVMPYNCFTGEGTGFSFFNYDSGVMLGTIKYALQTYWNREAMDGLIRAGMSVDSGFEKSSLEYARLFMSLIHRNNYVATHDPLGEEFRSPMGAIKAGESVTIRFRADDGLTQCAKLICGNESYEMTKKGDMFECTITPENAGIVWYRFLLDNQVNLSADGVDCGTRCFQLTVYEPDFETPEWAEGAVMYQIFPDRWCREGIAPEKGAKYHKKLQRTVNLRDDWNTPVKWHADEGETHYVPNDYYGGTLKGIEKSLPELAEMGVKCIYLNPIFEADSNHRYNTADYSKVDPILG